MFLPARIGRYEIKGRIGGGGMGTLYLARDTNPTTDRLVALKLLRASFDSDELRQRFAREAQSLAELNHPNIVIIYDSGEYQDAPFIVMEYIRGETLAESIKRRAPMSLGQKLGLLAELCAGLAHAHEAGIIHRDIKPANLMVDVHGRLKILDFGIARVVDTGMTRIEALTRLNVQIGTPGYMSPEQIEGGAIDSRSDLFSLGAVAYELISYREAFPGATTRQIENKVLGEQPVPLVSTIPGLDPEIAEIIDTALEKDPERRCQHASTLGRAFERVRARLEEEERLPETTPPPRPGAERRSRHERAAQAAYERALTSCRDGAEDYARRSAMEALAEYPQHEEARKLLASLGHLRDVEPWLPAPAAPGPVTPAPPAAGATPTPAPAPIDQSARTMIVEPGVAASPTIGAQPTVAAQPTAVPPTVVLQPGVRTGAPGVAPGTSATTEIAAESSGEVPGVPVEGESGPQQPHAAIGVGTVAPAGSAVRAEAPAATPAVAAPKPVVGSAAPAKAKAQPRVERRFGLRRMARAAVRLAIVIAGLALAAVVGGIVARRFWPPQGGVFELTITRPQGGTIVANDIECGSLGSKCAVSHPRGTEVLLQPRADAGFVFTAFTGDCASTGGTVMDAARTCGATFSPASAPPPVATEQLLTVDVPTGGTIEGNGIRCGGRATDCSAKQPANAQVTLKATPDEGFTFAGFTGDCAPSGGTTMTVSRRCGATFVPATSAVSAEWTLTVTRPTWGTILGAGIKCGVAGSECVSRHPQGSTVVLKAQAEKGYRLQAFTGDCAPAGRTVMTAGRTCGAAFVRDTVTSPPPPTAPVLTITRPAEGGTIFANGIICGSGGTQCSAPQSAGGSVMLRAQADAGYRFVAFTGDCDQGGAVVMSAARTCGATFTKETGSSTAVSFVLSVERSRDGTITGAGINCGTVCQVGRPRATAVQLRAQANAGYRLAGFKGDCDANGMTVMNGPRSCSAVFVRESGASPLFTLTITRPSDGTILGDRINCGASTQQCSATFPGGSYVQLRGEPNPGFTFAGFTDGCTPAGVVVMTAARTCGAIFTRSGPVTAAGGARVEIVAGQPAMVTAPTGWRDNVQWQVSSDAGASWSDLSNGADYAGVASATLTIKRPRAELSGRQYRARLTRGTKATSGAVTVIVRPPT